MGGGAALDMAAIGEHLPTDLLRQEAQRPCQERRMVRQCHSGGDQALQCGQRPCILLLCRECRRQGARIADEARHQLLAKQVVGGGGEKIIMTEPRGDTGTDHVGAVDDLVVRRRGDPFRHQRPRPQSGIVRTKRAQVAQPGEAMQGGPQNGRGVNVVPAARPQQAHRATILELALQQPRPAHRIAWPRIAHRQCRCIGYPGHPQLHADMRHPGDFAPRAAQPVAGGGALHVRARVMPKRSAFSPAITAA